MNINLKNLKVKVNVIILNLFVQFIGMKDQLLIK